MTEKIVSEIMDEMIRNSEGNLHDIAHFMKVYAFSRTIGVNENLDEDTLVTLEITAILHDIACPLCRKKYGNTNGRNQEMESAPLVMAFLKKFDLPEEVKERITFLVSHHHTYTNVDGIDYQILLESDFLVNADESNMTRETIENARHGFFRTDAGIKLLEEIYLK